MIERILHRTVPLLTTPEVEAWWATACDLHPGWEHLTHRDPLDPADWPLTAHAWPRCTSGAQQAGLIRLEALHRWGGWYIDSDVELYRSLEPLAGATVVAGWEDAKVVPDAVLGAEAGSQYVADMIELAISRLDQGAWESGPGVTTELLGEGYLPGVLVLPPGAFYPYHYSQKAKLRGRDHRAEQPWAFGAHHWHHSWG